ncbi:MAG: Holliday junction branch migration DNA helicase RuvB [Mycoplasmoidaceae bacterium]
MNSFKDFIGKEDIKDNLSIFINSARTNKKILDHILIFGQPGMGKTSISKLIAKELKTNIKIVQGTEIQTKKDIVNIVYLLKEGNILFIDEIHAVNKTCFEILYSLMDDFKININLGKDGNQKLTRLTVPKFTLIGATTLLGNIPKPFEDRFGINISLNEYTTQEIIMILKNYLLKNNSINVSAEEISIIAKHAKGTPRLAKNILKRVLDFKITNQISINEILKRMKIYEMGINENDINYLKLIYQNQNISLKTISQILFIDENTILNKIEPYLLKINYIEKSNKGRKLTEDGIVFMTRNNLI